MSGEQPSASHHDVQSQPVRLVFVCTIKYKYKSITVIQQTTLIYSKLLQVKKLTCSV
jgi:hypothetical protein